MRLSCLSSKSLLIVERERFWNRMSLSAEWDGMKDFQKSTS